MRENKVTNLLKINIKQKKEVKIFLNNINKLFSLNKYHILLSFLILRKDYIKNIPLGYFSEEGSFNEA